MAQIYSELNESIIAFIKAQPLFFMASAPLAADGHVNVSPKGYKCLHIVDTKNLLFLDYGGSGIETHSHVLENGRITLMFSAFSGKSNIVRLYGKGQVCAFDSPDFTQKLTLFDGFERARAIMSIKLHRVSESCGYAVPFFNYQGERDQLHRAHAHRSLSDWQERFYQTNSRSIDGLPGLTRP